MYVCKNYSNAREKTRHITIPLYNSHDYGFRHFYIDIKKEIFTNLCMSSLLYVYILPSFINIIQTWQRNANSTVKTQNTLK